MKALAAIILSITLPMGAVLALAATDANGILALLNHRHAQGAYCRELRWVESTERGILDELARGKVWVRAWGESQAPALRILEAAGKIKLVGEHWTLADETPLAPAPRQEPAFTDRSGSSVQDGDGFVYRLRREK